MHTAPDRKLTTILSADVAGYSAMMERDEPGTLALLKTSRDLMSHRDREAIAAASSTRRVTAFSPSLPVS